jgi:hypothetical protein
MICWISIVVHRPSQRLICDPQKIVLRWINISWQSLFSSPVTIQTDWNDGNIA